MAQKKTSFPWQKIAIGLLIPSLILNLFLLFKPSFSPTGVKVIGVIDGDTVVLEGKSRVRLRYVDAPEKNLCGYEEATKVLEHLALGEKVRIDEQIPDQYGRGMALVYTEDTLINAELLKSGWVRYHHDTSSQTETLKKASEYAKTEKLGIYGVCQSMENSQNPNCNIKGNIDKQTGDKKYYVKGCAQYTTAIIEKDIGENYFCTEQEAREAGYLKAETCGK
jgi:micrococcal nuclease